MIRLPHLGTFPDLQILEQRSETAALDGEKTIANAAPNRLQPVIHTWDVFQGKRSAMFDIGGGTAAHGEENPARAGALGIAGFIAVPGRGCAALVHPLSIWR